MKLKDIATCTAKSVCSQLAYYESSVITNTFYCLDASSSWIMSTCTADPIIKNAF